MDASWHLASVEVDHFRGVAGSLSLELGPGLNVIVGPNGAGKSSICNAIEWALFGKLPLVAGAPEFSSEDALTSRIASDGSAASVSLLLRREGARARVTRSRPRGSSSTRGTSTVTLDVDGTGYRRQEADAKIGELLALKVDDVGTSLYLRQDTIAELILGDEEVRSAAIDKLLGIGQVRELLENLQLSAIDRAIKQIGGEITSQKDNVISAAAMRRVQLQSKRDAFANAGIDDRDLSVDPANSRLAAISNRLSRIAETAGVPPSPDHRTHGTLAELRAAVQRVRSVAQNVNAGLNSREVAERARRSRLADLESRFEDVSKQSLAVAGVSLDELRALRQSLDDQRKAVRGDLQRARGLMLSVTPTLTDLESLDASIRRRQGVIAALQEEDYEAQNASIQERIDSLAEMLTQQSSLSRLLVAAREELAHHPSDSCPVCASPIDTTQTLSRLDALLAQGSQHASALSAEVNDLKRQSRTVTRMLEELAQESQALRGEAERRQRRLEEISEKGLDIGDGTTEALGAMQAGVERHLQELDASSTELEQQYMEVVGRIGEVEAIQATLTSVQVELAELLGRTDLPDDLAGAVQGATDAIERQLTLIGEARSELEQIPGQLETLGEIIAYLEDVEDLIELDAKIPPVRRRLAQLQAAQGRLTDLRNIAQEVYNALTAVQAEVLEGNLATLVPGLQNAFARLGGHPEYSRLALKVEADSKRGTNSYLIRAETEDAEGDTFVRTTFSRAELNVVAIALFIAVMAASGTALGLAILDDPSQSLDVARRSKLVDVLRELARERQLLVATEDQEFADLLAAGGGANVIALEHTPFLGATLRAGV